jgi:CheY-like chemotaxis protein
VILVAEDDDDTRDMIRCALETSGFSVVEARNGHDSLRIMFAEDAPDVRLIVADLDMPGMSGLELVRVLACYTRLSHIPIVIVSGTSPGAWPRVQVAGWLEKPFKLDALLGVVGQNMSTKRLFA